MAENDYYQLKVTLQGIRPPIWRRVVVPSNLGLSALHDVIQVAMGWQNCHLHEFEVGEVVYSEPDPQSPSTFEDERRYAVRDVLKHGARPMYYTYDYGDSWRHKVELEKVLPSNGTTAVLCLKGRRSCPPEDCGGVPGYMQILEALEHGGRGEEDFRALLEWLGPEFDPEHFDLKATNAELVQVLETDYWEARFGHENDGSDGPMDGFDAAEIAEATNAVVGAFLALKSKGFEVRRVPEDEEFDEVWIAKKSGAHFSAADPLALLGLTVIAEIHGKSWSANDAEIETFAREFGFDM